MTRPHARPRTAPRSFRALAVALLAGVAFAGWLYWHLSYVHGGESCLGCDAMRVADRRGPFWTYSQPTRSAAAKEPCAEHTWVGVGCWEQDGGFSYVGGPHRE